MVNPYFCYCLSFTIALMLYSLRWSNLYPSLSAALVAFLILTIIAQGLAGFRFTRKHTPTFTRFRVKMTYGPWIVTTFLYTLWIMEFAHGGGVPLVKILLNQPFDYKLFGIPTLHVFLVTFSSFYTVFLFHHYLSHKSPQILFLFAINLLAAVLIYNRGMLLFNISASAILFLIYLGRLPRKVVLWFVPSVLFLCLLFGVMGTLRVSNEAHTGYADDNFLQTAGASERFVDSWVPSEFFWVYLYATSPLANLEANIALNDPLPSSVAVVSGWINNEILFDFISKRINAYTGDTRAIQKRIHGPFNASTVYSGSYSYLGWTGIILMAGIILALPLMLIRIIPVASPFFLTAYAVLCALFLFMIFENTIRFTGLSFQLVYPLVFTFAIRKFPWVGNIFSLKVN